jgi:hypothetical protein
MLQLPLLVLVVLFFGIACTTVDSLKPGIPRGVYESGFMKTTEGLSLKVTNRSYDEVWAASEKAMSAGLTVIDRNKERGILRGSDADAFGFIRSYVGVFITPVQPRAEFYTVEVSKITRLRTQVAFTGPDFEVELLRAIQAEVGGQ